MSEGHMFNLTLENARIAVIGLGYVGLPLAVEFGKSRPVLGFDINAARVAALEAGHDATLEVEDRELKEAVHLRFSGNAADLVAEMFGASRSISCQESNIFECTRLLGLFS